MPLPVHPAAACLPLLLAGLPALGQATPSHQPPRGDQPTPALSPAAPAAESPVPPARPVNYSVEARAELNLAADFDSGAGDMTVTRAGGAFGAAIPAGMRGQIDVGVDYEFSHYSFSETGSLVAGVANPWDDIHRVELSVRYSRQHSQQVSWLVGGSLGGSGEDGADGSESLFGSVFGGVRYALNREVTLGFGLGVRTRIEDSPTVFPLPLVTWQINERWRLSTTGRPGVSLSYTPLETLSFHVSGAYDMRDFRLDENGPIPGGVGRETRVPVTIGVTHTPIPQVVLMAEVGVAFAQRLEVMNSGGDEIADEDLDPSALLRVSFTYRF
ncbi:MAG: hypothetical protein WD749_05025 [Phycisphaerales bacterium]